MIGIADASGVVGVANMREVSPKRLDFAASLMGPLKRCFKGNTDEIDEGYWTIFLRRSL